MLALCTSQFNFWKFPEALKDKDGLYIYLEGDGVGPYRDYFVSTGEILHLNLFRAGHILRRYRMVHGHGFIPEKGTENKLPTKPVF